MRFVIMGVSGCGKSTVGQAATSLCGIEFLDGDDLHPKKNIEKMSQGVPLNDKDRLPWLASIGQRLASADVPMMIGCSALKRTYRDTIRLHAGQVFFLHLHAPQSVLQKRVDERKDHFMPPSLLQSQFDALEALTNDECGTTIRIDQTFDVVVQEAARFVSDILAVPPV